MSFYRTTYLKMLTSCSRAVSGELAFVRVTLEVLPIPRLRSNVDARVCDQGVDLPIVALKRSDFRARRASSGCFGRALSTSRESG
jgi:hypothetical protein